MSARTQRRRLLSGHTRERSRAFKVAPTLSGVNRLLDPLIAAVGKRGSVSEKARSEVWTRREMEGRGHGPLLEFGGLSVRERMAPSPVVRPCIW